MPPPAYSGTPAKDFTDPENRPPRWTFLVSMYNPMPHSGQERMVPEFNEDKKVISSAAGRAMVPPIAFTTVQPRSVLYSSSQANTRNTYPLATHVFTTTSRYDLHYLLVRCRADCMREANSAGFIMSEPGAASCSC